jgi:hypothetical protein
MRACCLVRRFLQDALKCGVYTSDRRSMGRAAAGRPARSDVGGRRPRAGTVVGWPPSPPKRPCYVRARAWPVRPTGGQDESVHPTGTLDNSDTVSPSSTHVQVYCTTSTRTVVLVKYKSPREVEGDTTGSQRDSHLSLGND